MNRVGNKQNVNKMQVLKENLKIRFGQEPKEQENALKMHFKELNQTDISFLNDIYESFPEVENITVKRSGTGITIIVEVIE